MLGRAAQIYRASRKARDNFWTQIMTRPFAALLLVGLQGTGITPNQVTFLSLATALVAAGLLVWWRTWPGLVVAALVLQLSYVLDCADGQLARLRGIGSPVGHLLDFLMDELKAFVVLAAVTTRLFLLDGHVEELLLGLWGMVVVASGISLTTFVRRPEYQAAVAKPEAGPTPPRARPGPVGRIVRGVVGGAEAVAKFLIHYPSYFLYVAVFDRLEIYLYAYVGVHTLYLLRTFLGILLALGRPGFDPLRSQRTVEDE